MLQLDIRHRAGEFHLDAAFETPTGSITAIFGQSGAGKTTLINLIAGLTTPSDGHIISDGHTLFRSDRGIDIPAERRRIGYVFQEGRLFPHMDVRRNLVYGHRRNPVIDLAQITRLLDLGGLLQRRPASLSGGERQRVAIGRALLSNPNLLLMDEPLASIDAQRRGEILPFIERLRDHFKITIVYVSHAVEEVIRLADTMVLLSDGQVAAVGGVEELMSRLDLFPLTGRSEAGAVLAATCQRFDPEYRLAELGFPGGTLRVAGAELEVGTAVRVHVRARDVSLMIGRPERTSVLNVFEGTVAEITDTGSPQVDVRLEIGGDAAASPLIASITRKSLHDLGIRVGLRLHALVKAVAIDRRSLTGGHKRQGTR